MTLIEITLIAIALVLIAILINQTYLSNLAIYTLAKNKKTLNKILIIFKKIYSIFKKARRFSVFYVFKNNFYQLYLAIAVVIVSIKILLYKSVEFSQILPVEIERIVNFLIVSSAWEIACVVTKIIERNTPNK